MKPSDAAVLELLRTQRHQGVTAIEALTDAGTFRLAARINDLRNLGYAIETRMIETNRGARIARYYLLEDPDEVKLAKRLASTAYMDRLRDERELGLL
jgi:hypothetical protein